MKLNRVDRLTHDFKCLDLTSVRFSETLRARRELRNFFVMGLVSVKFIRQARKNFRRAIDLNFLPPKLSDLPASELWFDFIHAK